MDEKKQRQIKLAKIFYEMGMDEDLVSKISGIEKDDLKHHLNVDKSDAHKYNNRANKN